MKILSMNVCGMPGTGFHRRRTPVGHAIGRLKPDLAALQEVFFESDARMLGAGLELPHAFRQKRLGMLAGGLSLHSRHPLHEAQFVGFREQGAWYRLSFLARLNQKGFIFARWERPRLGIIVTHLLSNYVRNHDAGAYARWQESQAAQLVEFIHRVDPGLPLVVMGDFNVPPRSRSYRLLRAAGLEDAMEGCEHHSMISKKELNLGIFAPNDLERVDFVFLRAAKSRKSSLRCGYVLGKEGLSDHQGLLAELGLE